MQRHTKIIATLGPAVASAAGILALVEAGIDVRGSTSRTVIARSIGHGRLGAMPSRETGEPWRSCRTYKGPSCESVSSPMAG